jgi:anaerobic magnesium-protoporphyrin IX monomethyl ester cyclase
MKTLLIYPPCSPLFGPPEARSLPMPLGIPCLCAYLKNQGKSVSFLDLNVKLFRDTGGSRLWTAAYRRHWEQPGRFDREVRPAIDRFVDRRLDAALQSDVRIVGLYHSYGTSLASLYLARKLKERSKQLQVILGGPSCFEENIERLLATGLVDAVVQGEGELTLLELVDGFERTGRIPLCRGVHLRTDGEVRSGGERELIQDLNGLPYPDFTDAVEDYRAVCGNVWLSISWLRGCTHRCAFCYESRFWKTCRVRSPESIADEFAFQAEKYGIRGFNKADSILAPTAEHLAKVCDLLIARKADVLWYSQARAEDYLTPELLAKMRTAGCAALCYGVESGSQKVLDTMNKGLNVKVMERVVRDSAAAGIRPSLTLMVNAPGESIWDFLKTVLLVIRNRKFSRTMSISPAGITPGSDWYRHPGKYGLKLVGDLRRDGWIRRNAWQQRYRNGIKLLIMRAVKAACGVG